MPKITIQYYTEDHEPTITEEFVGTYDEVIKELSDLNLSHIVRGFVNGSVEIRKATIYLFNGVYGEVGVDYEC